VKRAIQSAYVIAALLLTAAVVLTFVGPRYAISKIPLAEQQRMSDFDWIGAEWIGAAFAIALLALLVAGLAFLARRFARTGKSATPNKG
jgi:uncharacterized membrane protein YhaH (DUF805 family)